MNKKDETGFTLIELMIAVAVIAVLAAVALPAYTDHLKRGKRSAAASYMQTLANKEEQQLLNTRCYFSYPTDASCTPPSGITIPGEVSTNYTITIAATNVAGTPPTYTITAARTSVNSDTKCGDLSLTNTGTKGATGSSGATYCWK
jgi:type IV pilus assembly protein PilE